MLPLWIIDLTRQSDRQSHFVNLLGQMDGVQTNNDFSQVNSDHPCHWLYSRFENPFEHLPSSENEEMASAVYQLQEDLIAEGQQFIQMLRLSNVTASTTLNICVLGDSTERFSQLIFPSLAIMLQKEKGRIVPNHIHQGLIIVGSLYIPSHANSLQEKDRASIHLLLKEIEVQHNISSARGYDRMFIYQNVQNRTENFYPILDKKGEAEYLLQSMIHLYYACDATHPLISGSGAHDHFYFSLGVASTYFDTTALDVYDHDTVANQLFETINDTGDHESIDTDADLLDIDKIDPEEMITNFKQFSIDMSLLKMKEPHPHPIADFANRKLKRLYYQQYLKYYPANLRIKIIEEISRQSSSVLDSISAKRRKMQTIFQQMTLPAAVREQLSNSTTNTGYVPRIQRNLKKLKETIGEKKLPIANKIKNEVWNHLMQKNVPRNLKDSFEEYHDCYASSRKGIQECEEMKDSALNDLVNCLKQEATYMSRITRSFLAGIIFVLTFMPCITLLSEFIDIGNVKQDAFYWSMSIFMLPILWQFLSILLAKRKRGQKERRLIAYYLHDAYARIANKIISETNYLYDNMMSLCDEYINRSKEIQTKIHANKSVAENHTELPTTRFNQPLVGGSFNGQTLIPYEKDESRKININRVPQSVNRLDKSDYHILLHQYQDIVQLLFSDINYQEELNRKFDEKKGYKVFITQSEKRNQENEAWQRASNKFFEKIHEAIDSSMLPRVCPNIGLKIRSYVSEKENQNFLTPILLMAATNGELTSKADNEYADIKTDYELTESLVKDQLPLHSTQYQIDEHKSLFNKYLFVSRWRTFDSIAFNRILPSEDFDWDIRKEKINEEELQMKQDAISSLILWAMCKDDKSTEWLKLFDGTHLNETLEKRHIFREKLNAKD